MARVSAHSGRAQSAKQANGPRRQASGQQTAIKRKKPAGKIKLFSLFNGYKVGRIDLPLLTLVIILLLFGLVMLFSASYPSGHLRRGNSYAFIWPQVRYALVGIVAMFAASFFDYRILKKFAWPIMAVTLFMLTIVLFMEAKNGAKRWIWLTPSHSQSFQPSEIAKLAVIILFAAIIAANQKRIKTFTYGFLPFIVVLGMVSGLLILEPHLSCTILILGIGCSMMFAGGTPIKWFVMAGALAAAALYFALTTFPDLVPYAFDRINAWIDPFSVPDAKTHQIIQSLIAIGSGGFTGSGIGNSVQKFFYLPEMYNDYIFAVLCEELGFIGAVAVIILFFLLLVRGLYIAVKVEDKFGSMLVVGISIQIALQAFVHIAVNTNTIPSTGISMPFFSSGGSSLLMLLGQVGIMLSVSRHMGKAEVSAKGEPEKPANEELDSWQEPATAERA